MKLVKGKKPEALDIPSGIPYTSITYQNGYTEITINDITEIDKLKNKGYKQQ